MKIDLHIHTKKIAKGDAITRNIEAEEFKEKLKDSNVGIAAITNHYFFDKDQYNEFKDESYILLPGVELDITIDSRRVQVNIISSPEEIDVLVANLDEIENDKRPLPYNDLLSYFDREKWIISVDFKNSGNTSWTEEDMTKLQNDIKSAMFLADTNKATTLMVLNSHDFNAFIGSDVTDWKNYVKESEKLINTELNITSYDKFWTILQYKETDIKELFYNIHEKKMNGIKMPETEYMVEDIKIKQGVNVIFGAKKTGKTKILEGFKEQLNENQSYYSSSEKEETIEDFKKNLLNQTLYESKKTNFLQRINNILEYKETKFNKFNNFYLFSKGAPKIKFQNKLNTLAPEPTSLNLNTKNKTETIRNILIHLNKAEQELKKMGIDFKGWSKESLFIKQNLLELYKNIYKEYWKTKANERIIRAVNKIISSHNGISAKPVEVGLFKRFNEKKAFSNSLIELRNEENHIKNNIKKFKIPGREEVNAAQEIRFIDFFNDKNKENRQKFKGKAQLDKVRKILSAKNIPENNNKIVELISGIKQKYNTENWYFTEEVIIKDINGDSGFSNGEKAHLLLEEKLSKDKQYYLLDEPAVFLSKESITDFLLPKISELVKLKKTIVIVTHNSSLGINTIPINYIYRKYSNGDDKCKTYIGTIWENKFVNIEDDTETVPFQKGIIGSFEGSKKHFKFRKDIYEN